MFWREYVERTEPWALGTFRTHSENGRVNCQGTVFYQQTQTGINGDGNGPLAALVDAICKLSLVPRFEITAYSEHALSSGEAAVAIAYIQLKTVAGVTRWGAGVDTNIELASVRAVLSALNRLA